MYINVGATSLLVHPKNCLARITELTSANKPRTVKQFRAKLSAFKCRRVYPSFSDGQSTHDYVSAYFALNFGRLRYISSDPDRDVKEIIANFFEPLSMRPMRSQYDETLEEVMA